ncbi:hypothetical protein [Desulfosoma sp.]
MGLAIKVYEAFRDEPHKAQVLSEVVDILESRMAIVGNVATRDDLEITKLHLQKEMEQLRREVEQIRAELKKEMAQLRCEVEQIRAELKVDLAATKTSLVKWVAGMLLAQTGVVASLFALFR